VLTNLRGLSRVLAACAVLLTAATLLSACNTTAGLGQDVKATGNAVTNGADSVKQGL
jgi:entericidin B